MRPIVYRLPADHAFDYRFLLDVLARYRHPREKIGAMLRNREIIRVRKGLYVRSHEFGGTVEPVEVANLVYGPSYVSLEYALSRHGMIPEAVPTITSVTTKRSRAFSTPLGRFAFDHIPLRAFPAGIEREQTGSVPVLIAGPEKALCDKLSLTAGIRTLRELETFLVENQRLDMDVVAEFSRDTVLEITSAYGTQRMRLFAHWFEKNYAHAGVST
jgi:hypothetical protein